MKRSRTFSLLLCSVSVLVQLPGQTTVENSPVPLERDADTQLLLVWRDGTWKEPLNSGLVIKPTRPGEPLPGPRFDKGHFLRLDSHDCLNLTDDFTVEAIVRVTGPVTEDFRRIVSRESFNPRGGYSLAIRRNGSLAFWASGKSWLNTRLLLRPNKWHRVGVMARGGRLFLFVDDSFSQAFDFDGPPCLPTKANAFVGLGFPGEIFSVRFSSKPRFWHLVTPRNEDWELPADYLKDNGWRGKVVLNGFWGGRPQGDTREHIKLRVPDLDRRAGYEYYREFALPEGWERRRVFLPLAEDSPRDRGPAFRRRCLPGRAGRNPARMGSHALSSARQDARVRALCSRAGRGHLAGLEDLRHHRQRSPRPERPRLCRAGEENRGREIWFL